VTSLLSSLPRDSLLRVVRDLCAEEIARVRGSAFDPLRYPWDESLAIGAGGLHLDSLERFSCAARMNEFFSLFESGVEDNLLRASSLGDLLDVVGYSLDHCSGSVTFRSGGTVAAPRRVSHSREDLEQEVRELGEIFRGRARWIITVPVHHIYGFIFGVLLPAWLDAAVVDARWSLLGGAARPRPGDVLISVPYLWQRLHPRPAVTGNQDHADSNPDLWGVSSTAPLAPDLADRLVASGLTRLIEVYGSSESGGVGRREHGEERGGPFTLFSFWRRAPGDRPDHVLERITAAGVRELELPDRVEWIDSRRLRVLGRRDAVVQVGGHNVDLEQLRRRILEILPGIDNCALRMDAAGERLRVFLAAPEALPDEDITRLLRGSLADHELPVEVLQGTSLPRTGTGKIAEW
jgi:long-chain acyl-CoA synthetase